MRQLAVLESDQQEIKLHTNILDILFAHKRDIFRKLSDVRDLYFLDHVAISIFNPENEVIIFSITPSVEYNVITQNLWKHDITFNPSQFSDGSLVWWDQDFYSKFAVEIKQIKETKHNFSIGFNLYRKIDGFNLVYSFASRCQNKNMRHYYDSIKNRLFLLGDYSYKLIREIYTNYCISHDAPYIVATNTENQKPFLKLIINNNE